MQTLPNPTKRTFLTLIAVLGLIFCAAMSLSIVLEIEASSPINIARISLAALTGAALAVCGCALQALFQNPLADPYVVGVTGGAAAGGAIAILIAGSAFYMINIGAIAGALLTCLMLAYVLARRDVQAALLVGIAINAIASSVVTLIKSLLPPELNQAMLFWLVGNIESASPKRVALMALLLLPCLWGLLRYRGPLTLVSFGFEEAKRLGVKTQKLQINVYMLVSIIVGVIVSLTGMIGFVGLIIPQLLKLFFGDEQRLLMPASLIVGATFLVICDAFSKFIQVFFHIDLPAGVFTALLGSPIFIWLLIKGPRA